MSATSKQTTAPRTFVSYAWEDDEYKDWVKALAARLREDGVDLRLDAWHSRGKTIGEFMNSEVRLADKVLILCSPQYQEKVHAMEEDQRMTASGWEAMLVSSSIRARLKPRATLVPVLARGAWEEAAPSFLLDFPYVDLSDLERFESRYTELLRRLLDREESAPPIGAPPPGIDPPVAVPLRGSGSAPGKAATATAAPSETPSPEVDLVSPMPAVAPGTIGGREGAPVSPARAGFAWSSRMAVGMAIVGLIVLVCIAAVGVWFSKQQAHIAAGQRALNIGRYGEARASFGHALALNPFSSQAAWGEQVAALQSIGDGVEFENQVRELLKRRPGDPYINMFRGDLHDAEGETAGAIKRYQAAIRAEPMLAEAYWRLGLLYDRAGEMDKAETMYRQAIEQSWSKPKYRNNLAYVYATHGRYSEARAEYEKNNSYPLSALEVAAYVYWAQADLVKAKQRQELAVAWLADTGVVALPENQGPWEFHVGGERIELVSLPEKRCLALLSLAATQCLLDEVESARDTRDRAREQCGARFMDVGDVVTGQLAGLPRHDPGPASKAAACRAVLLDSKSAAL